MADVANLEGALLQYAFKENTGAARLEGALLQYAVFDEAAPSGGNTMTETTPIANVSSDYTINAISGSSVQYTRTVEQVPVILSVRGVPSLRGRITAPAVTIDNEEK